MNNFIMFVGVPCSGKTTFLNDNQLDITRVYGVDTCISSDAVIEDIAQARGLTYSEVFKDSIELARKYIDSMMGILSLQQRNFILDQTNLTIKSRKSKLNMLIHPQNYTKIAIVFNDTDEDILRLRHSNRSEETGKTIPDNVIEDIRKSFVLPSLEEGFNKIMTVSEFKDSLIVAEPVYGEMKFN